MLSKIKNYITDNTGILIRIDDIAENMNWDIMKKSELLFEKYSIKPVIGVVPNNQDNEFLEFPKKDDFWEQVKDGKLQCMDILMCTIKSAKKAKIISIMEEDQSLLVIH